jgi:hypothetical protein
LDMHTHGTHNSPGGGGGTPVMFVSDIPEALCNPDSLFTLCGVRGVCGMCFSCACGCACNCASCICVCMMYSVYDMCAQCCVVCAVYGRTSRLP